MDAPALKSSSNPGGAIVAVAERQRAGAATRDERLGRLEAETFDVLVVGGGITGAGVARDAALRGLSVALVERNDYGSGTSSKSSKLVHGGLRYLENLELGLVFEATRERYRLRRLNPNLVWPLPFVFPVYRTDRHSLFKINVGLWLYDLLSLFRSWRLHRRMSRDRTRALVPGLAAEGLVGSVHYYDCHTDDARLTLANVLDAERHGATCINHVGYLGPIFEDGRVAGARVVDALTGAERTVRCRHIVYAGGPWTDSLQHAPGDGRLLRRTKGVHVVVARERLPLEAAVVMTAVTDGRVVFAIPFENTTYIGTTDTDYDGDLDAVRATSDDVDYLLTTANRYFPQANLTAADVRSTWAGLRPLIRSDAESAYATSREHQRYDDARGITTIAGGKLTTYRSMAAEVVDAAARRLRRVFGKRAGRCRTHRLPLDPALPRVDDIVRGLPDPLDNALWRLHGSAGAWVRERMRSHPEEAVPLTAELPYVLAQVTWCVLGEQAARLDDVLIRRLHVFYRAADQGLSCAPVVARHMAALLGRDEAWVQAEVARYADQVELSMRGPRALAAAP